MNDEEAKSHLAELLQRHTAGSLLHLISDLYRESAEDARQADDAVVYERCRLVEHTLFVTGLGIDAAFPS